MALPAAGSLSESCWTAPFQIQRPPAVRFGQGTSTAPALRDGRRSTGKVSTYGTPAEVKARRPAPTSVTVAATSPAAISNCSPVGGRGRVGISGVSMNVVGVIAGSKWMHRKAEEPPIPGYRRRRQRREAPPGPARTRRTFVDAPLQCTSVPVTCSSSRSAVSTTSRNERSNAGIAVSSRGIE